MPVAFFNFCILGIVMTMTYGFAAEKAATVTINSIVTMPVECFLISGAQIRVAENYVNSILFCTEFIPTSFTPSNVDSTLTKLFFDFIGYQILGEGQ